MREDLRDAGTDEIGEAKSRRHIVFAAQQAVEPVMLVQPQARLDDIVSFVFLRKGCKIVLVVSSQRGGEHAAYLDSVAVCGS